MLDARFEYVFSNRERGEGNASDSFFDRVCDLRIPLVNLSSGRFRRERGGGSWTGHRDAFHAEVMRRVARFDADYCVLAGYMLITSDEMCRCLVLVNLHPALPSGPTGTWQQVIWKLIESGAVEAGVMVHVATEVLDGGPVLAYCTYPIRGPGFDHLWAEVSSESTERLREQGEDQPLFAAIRAEGLRWERPLLVETLRSLAVGGLAVRNRMVIDGGGAELRGGLRLDAEVEARLSAGGAG